MSKLIKFIWRNLVNFGFIFLLVVTLAIFGYGYTQRSRVHAYDDLKVVKITHRKPLKTRGMTITVLKRTFDQGEKNVTYQLKVASPKKKLLPITHFYIADFTANANLSDLPVNMLGPRINNKYTSQVKPGTNIVSLVGNIWPGKDHSKMNLVFLRYEASKRRYALYILD